MATKYCEIREYTMEDYQMVSGWWAAHKWPAVLVAALPKLGVIATIDGQGVAAGWLYMDNSVGVCWLEWLVTNPDNSPRESLRAIATIAEFLSQRAKAAGYGLMMTTCRQESLARLHERNGFNRTDSGVIHMTKFL